jgi:glycine/D-amino acid oxidase-like deaminating enzyme
MMVGMIVGGWIFGRKATGHGGHGMMMCHPMGHGGPDQHADETAATIADLKAERERLDEIIARAERDGVAR